MGNIEIVVPKDSYFNMTTVKHVRTAVPTHFYLDVPALRDIKNYEMGHKWHKVDWLGESDRMVRFLEVKVFHGSQLTTRELTYLCLVVLR